MNYLIIFAFFTSFFSILKDIDDLNNWRKILSLSFSCIALIISFIPIMLNLKKFLKNIYGYTWKYYKESIDILFEINRKDIFKFSLNEREKIIKRILLYKKNVDIIKWKELVNNLYSGNEGQIEESTLDHYNVFIFKNKKIKINDDSMFEEILKNNFNSTTLDQNNFKDENHLIYKKNCFNFSIKEDNNIMKILTKDCNDKMKIFLLKLSNFLKDSELEYLIDNLDDLMAFIIIGLNDIKIKIFPNSEDLNNKNNYKIIENFKKYNEEFTNSNLRQNIPGTLTIDFKSLFRFMYFNFIEVSNSLNNDSSINSFIISHNRNFVNIFKDCFYILDFSKKIDKSEIAFSFSKYSAIFLKKYDSIIHVPSEYNPLLQYKSSNINLPISISRMIRDVDKNKYTINNIGNSDIVLYNKYVSHTLDILNLINILKIDYTKKCCCSEYIKIFKQNIIYQLCFCNIIECFNVKYYKKNKTDNSILPINKLQELVIFISNNDIIIG